MTAKTPTFAVRCQAYEGLPGTSTPDVRISLRPNVVAQWSVQTLQFPCRFICKIARQAPLPGGAFARLSTAPQKFLTPCAADAGPDRGASEVPAALI